MLALRGPLLILPFYAQALCSSCGQVERPGLLEEAVWPSAVIQAAFGFAADFSDYADFFQAGGNPRRFIFKPCALAKLMQVFVMFHHIGSNTPLKFSQAHGAKMQRAGIALWQMRAPA